MCKKSLFVNSALISIILLSYSTTSYAACTAVGSVVTCTGSSATNTSTQSFNPLNNAKLTANAGFGVDVAAGTAISVIGDGALSFTDTNTINSVYIKGNGTGNDGIYFHSTADDGGTSGSINIYSNSNIVSVVDDGIAAINSGTGNNVITINGDINSGDEGVNLDSDASTTNTEITTGSSSNINSGDDGINADLNGTGSAELTINGDINSDDYGIFFDNAASTINTEITIGSSSNITSDNNGIRSGSYGTGYVELTINGDINSSNRGVFLAAHPNTTNTVITTGSGSNITSSDDGFNADLNGTGSAEVTINGDINAGDEGINLFSGASTTNTVITTGSGSNIISTNDGINANLNGTGSAEITINGDINSGDEGVNLDSDASTTNTEITTGSGSNIISTNDGINANLNGTGSAEITINGDINSDDYGIFFDNAASTINTVISIGSSSNITSDNNGIRSRSYGTGYVELTINGDINSSNRGVFLVSHPNTTNTVITTGSGSNITGTNDGMNIENQGSGTTTLTISGDVTGGTGNALDISQSNSASDVILTINSGSVVRSNSDTAIITNAGMVMNMNIDCGSVIGTGGTAIDMNDANDFLTISGAVNFTGDIEGGAGTDTLTAGKTTLSMTSGSSFLNFETVNVTGKLTSKAGTDVDINSASSVNVRGGISSDIASASSFGKVTSSNGFTFSNGANLSVTTSGRLIEIADGTILNDVLSGGAIEGITSGVLSDDNPAYKFTSIVNGSDVNILVSKPDLTTIGFGSVSSFANVINGISQTTKDTGLRSVISGIIDAPDDATRETYIKTLLPESNSAKFQVGKNVLQKSFSVVQTRMNNVRNLASNSSGIASGDSIDRKSAWFSFFNKDIGQGYRDGEFGYDSKIKGITLGVDFNYGDNTIIGSSFSYANSDIETRVLGSNSRVDSQNLIFFVSQSFKNNIYLDLLASAGLSQIEATRVLFDNTSAFSNYDGYQLGTEVNIGYSTNLKRMNLMPYLSAKYNYFAYDDFSEDGSSAPLNVDSTDVKSFESELGIEVAYPFIYKDAKYVPKASIGWQHDFINEDVKSNASFVSQPSTSFRSGSNASGRDLFNLGLGLDISAMENMDISLDYKLEAKKEFKAHSTALNAKFSF